MQCVFFSHVPDFFKGHSMNKDDRHLAFSDRIHKGSLQPQYRLPSPLPRWHVFITWPIILVSALTGLFSATADESRGLCGRVIRKCKKTQGYPRWREMVLLKPIVLLFTVIGRRAPLGESCLWPATTCAALRSL